MKNTILKWMFILGVLFLIRANIDNTILYFITFIFIAIPLQKLWDNIIFEEDIITLTKMCPVCGKHPIDEDLGTCIDCSH